VAGLLAYPAALALLYGQSISSGDLWPVVVSSLVAFGLCYWLLYLPVLRAVRHWLPRPRWVWVFPLLAMLLGVLPTALVARYWGGSLRAMLSPEALLFYILFAVVGLVVGLGFTRLDRQ
jgi:H+/Cl- antiporter ClcA